MKKLLYVLGTICVTAGLLSACNEGPAEKKGRKIDKQVESVKDKILDKGPAQKAGEKLDDLNKS